MFNSLKLKLLVYLFFMQSVVLICYSVFIYEIAQRGVSNTYKATLKMISLDSIPDLKTDQYSNAQDISQELINEFNIEPLHIKIIYYDKVKNKIKYQSTSLSKKNDLFDIPLNEKGHLRSIYIFQKGEYHVSSMLVMENNKTKVFFQVAMKKTVHTLYLNTLFTSLLLASPIILMLLLLIGNKVINKTLKPVKEVISSVKKISSTKLSNRLDGNSLPIEIKDLVDTFNKLLDNLEESFNKISQFSSDASHELKTPLTVMRGELEVCLKQERTPNEYKEVIVNALEEVLALQKIVEQLLFFTRKDTVEMYKSFKETYVDELILDTTFQMQSFAFNKSVSIKVVNLFPFSIFANEELMKIAINNILRNAVIYSEEKNEVIINTHDESKCYIITIEDFGCGIAEKNIPHIFDRFYRVDMVRSRNTGLGLGLSIVKAILDIHKYDIVVESTLGKGTKFSIIIPKNISI